MVRGLLRDGWPGKATLGKLPVTAKTRNNLGKTSSKSPCPKVQGKPGCVEDWDGQAGIQGTGSRGPGEEKRKRKKGPGEENAFGQNSENLQDGHIIIIIFAGGPHNHLLPLPQPSKLQL